MYFVYVITITLIDNYNTNKYQNKNAERDTTQNLKNDKILNT